VRTEARRRVHRIGARLTAWYRFASVELGRRGVLVATGDQVLELDSADGARVARALQAYVSHTARADAYPRCF
jgi:hypothetical protein